MLPTVLLTFDTHITITHTPIATTSTLNRTTGTTMDTTSIQEKVKKLYIILSCDILVFAVCGVLGEVGDVLGDGEHYWTLIDICDRHTLVLVN